MRHFHSIGLIVAVGCLMGAGQSDLKTSKTDLKTIAERQKILGQWEVVSAKRDGKA
jgi:phosphoribosylcarboxyaminoimidazole (NCAIR) mutase